VNDAVDVAKYQGKIMLLPTSWGGNQVTLEIDHVAKQKGEKTALGSQHKKAGITGASYLFDNVQHAGEGGVARSKIFVAKDSEGGAPGGGDDRFVGVLKLDSSVTPWSLEISPDTWGNERQASGPSPDQVVAELERGNAGTLLMHTGAVATMRSLVMQHFHTSIRSNLTSI